MVPMEMKNLSLEDFKNKIRRWKPDVTVNSAKTLRQI